MNISHARERENTIIVTKKVFFLHAYIPGAPPTTEIQIKINTKDESYLQNTVYCLLLLVDVFPTSQSNKSHIIIFRFFI